MEHFYSQATLMEHFRINHKDGTFDKLNYMTDISKKKKNILDYSHTYTTRIFRVMKSKDLDILKGGEISIPFPEFP